MQGEMAGGFRGIPRRRTMGAGKVWVEGSARKLVETSGRSASVLGTTAVRPSGMNTGGLEERIWKGFARLVNPGTQTREPGAPLRSCHNLSSSFRSLLR